MAEAGCEDKIDRNVLGTVASTGFAELRARVEETKSEARQMAVQAFKVKDDSRFRAWSDVLASAQDLLERLDAIEADAKDASTGSYG